ncbi:MAG: Trm112 family protein [Calditrichia bacterium]
MLDQELLDILACPKCKGELEYKVDEKNNKNGELVCHSCRLIYQVDDDIPIMLIDEAKSY